MREPDEYLTLKGLSEGAYKEKGSRFLAFAAPASTVSEVREQLETLRKKYHDARHHCYAYAIGPDAAEYRYNDDGEPSGTAGKPIYGQILSFGLTNVLIVVVRYFGGIKLGTGGLVNAYRTAAKEAITSGLIVTKIWSLQIGIRFGYEKLNEIMRLVKEENAAVIAQDFRLDSNMILEIRKSKLEGFEKKISKLENVELTVI